MKKIAQIKAWKEAHRDQHLAKLREWHSQNRAHEREYAKAWKAANTEQQRTWSKEWRARHSEIIRTQSKVRNRRYYEKGGREKQKQRYEQYREEKIAQAIEWNKKNPIRRRVIVENDRVKRKSAMGDGEVTAEQWSQILAFYGHRCAQCHATKKLHMDHYIPLSSKKPGLHHWTNLWPLCQKCNSSKHNHLLPGVPPHAIAFLLEAS